MPPPNLEIFHSANLYLELHGDEAVAKARAMVRTMQDRGDRDGADRWLQIIVAIEALQHKTARGSLQ